ncbi:MAG: tetratricopeptide repeat protein [Elsteraceae bacterium]
MAWLDRASPPGLVEAAQEMILEGKIDEATRALEAIAEEYPNCDFALRTLGYHYHEIGREVDAVHVLERTVMEDPQGELLKNAAYFRTQISLRILDGQPPNGDGPVRTRGFDPA